ncbi:DMT family transporter [Pontivivens insulae]|uniref:EamA domain-containing protein n=1 Tax=Pontivivens insulae TaxID=1639689 RepID=A0A2R8AAM2_9RHOB|nr:DMT family transporter [Pontivivens insulae]RED13174.1 EamA domain-containing membrane protein RarD [Pontivivens insulae]SPF29266.1 hypothetical protein POI8812_01573 [Pontivivens insulae]
MTEQRTMTNAAWAQLILLALIWGGSFFSIAIALREVSVLQSVLHRVGWAALALWVIALAQGHSVPRSLKIWIGFMGMGLLNNIIPFTLMAWGQTEIETGLVSILNASTALFGVVIAAALLRDEQLTRAKAVGTALGFAGVVTVIGWSALKSFDIRSAAQLAVIGGTVSYAFAGVWARYMLQGLSPVVAAAGMLLASTLIMLPVVLVYEGLPSLKLNFNTWAAIGYYALIATAGAYLLYYRILAVAGSSNLMLVTLLIPPVAIALGATFLGETLPPSALPGFALIALGLLVIDGRLGRALFKRSPSR